MDDGTVACLLAAPRVQLFAGSVSAVSLAHANQLPLRILQSTAVLESESSKQCYSKCRDL